MDMVFIVKICGQGRNNESFACTCDLTIKNQIKPIILKLPSIKIC